MQNKINITPIPRNVMLKFQAFLIKRMCFNFLHCSINVMIKEYRDFKGNLTTDFNHHGSEFLLINLPSIENQEKKF